MEYISTSPIRNIETIEQPKIRPREENFKESMLFDTKHKTVKAKVQSILRKDKYARKNYFYLCLLYWVQNGDITMNIDFKDFEKITKPETISRCCRELVSDARKGNQDLKWLLNDTDTLDERESNQELNRNYYYNKNINEKSFELR